MIQTYLDLSTGHVSQQTMARLSNPHSVFSGWPAMSIAPYEHGVFLTVPSEMTNEEMDALPSDLENVISFASDKGATLVRLDSAGPDHAELPTFEW